MIKYDRNAEKWHMLSQYIKYNSEIAIKEVNKELTINLELFSDWLGSSGCSI